MSFDILIRLLASGGSQVESEIRKGATAAKNLDKSLDKVGSNGGLKDAEAKVKSDWDSVDSAKKALRT